MWNFYETHVRHGLTPLGLLATFAAIAVIVVVLLFVISPWVSRKK